MPTDWIGCIFFILKTTTNSSIPTEPNTTNALTCKNVLFIWWWHHNVKWKMHVQRDRRTVQQKDRETVISTQIEMRNKRTEEICKCFLETAYICKVSIWIALDIRRVECVSECNAVQKIAQAKKKRRNNNENWRKHLIKIKRNRISHDYNPRWIETNTDAVKTNFVAEMRTSGGTSECTRVLTYLSMIRRCSFFFVVSSAIFKQWIIKTAFILVFYFILSA